MKQDMNDIPFARSMNENNMMTDFNDFSFVNES